MVRLCDSASTIIGKTFCIRFAVGSVTTRAEHIQEAWEIIREAARQEIETVSS